MAAFNNEERHWVPADASDAKWVAVNDWILENGRWADTKNWNDSGVWVDAALVWTVISGGVDAAQVWNEV